jgi:hypothetical protein
MRNGLRWPSFWACCWALVLCICFFSAPPISAQETTDSEQSRLIESLKLRLQTIIVLAENLESESASWKTLSQGNEQRAQELLSELAALRQELESSRADSEALSLQVAELKALQEKSENKLQVLLATWKRSAELWKEAAEAAQLQVRKVRARGVLWIALAALAGGAAGWALK